MKKLHDSGSESAVQTRKKQKEILKTGTFTIQLLALKNPVELSHFKNLEGVVKYMGNDGYTRYTYGQYNGSTDAKEAITKIINKGYTDAFVVNIEKYKN